MMGMMIGNNSSNTFTLFILHKDNIYENNDSIINISWLFSTINI